MSVFNQEWAVIQCRSLSDNGKIIIIFKGLFSWFKAIHHADYFDYMNDGFIYGVKRIK